ncbi:MAG: tetratricopeptide repeat protein [Saprospiraceae bacterium]|nr:tetratricopeptide repeat protein [Saprospiraceae bacterium]
MLERLLKEAELLMETNRPAQAEEKIRQALAEAPGHSGALAALAWSLIQQEKYPGALEAAQQAVAGEPDQPNYLFALGYAQLFNNQPDKARETAQAALQLAPDASVLYQLLAQIEFQERRWELALHNAEKGLEFEPDDDGLINLRAMILVKLNRTAEAGDTVDSALYQNPQNAYAHANKGWVKIEQGQYQDAQESFLEALRLDPSNEHAKDGLKESIKAKNLLYRVILRYFLWVNKLSSGNQWLVIIGAYIAFRMVRGVAKSNPNLAPLLMPIIVLYLIFVYSSWIAGPVSNLFLRLHPLGKHALTDDEKLGSNLAAACIGASALFWLTGWLANWHDLFLIGAALLVLLIPVGGMFSVQPGRSARRYLGWYALFMAVCGVAVPLLAFISGQEDLLFVGLAGFGIGAIAYGWVANYLIMRDAKRF